MRNLSKLLFITLAAYALSGCGGSVGVDQIGCAELPTGQRDCGLGPTYTIPFSHGSQSMKYTAQSTFDAGLVSLDLSSSTAPIDSTNGYITVSLDLVDGTTVSNSFQWINVGDELVASNPSAVNAWFSQHMADIEEVDTDLNFTAGSEPGANMVAAEVEYSSSYQGGTTTSWYDDSGGSCGISDCDDTID